jgi:magnesium-transporting ATPase (P-type)
MSELDERGKRCIAAAYLEDVETIVRELGSDTRAGLSSAQAQLRLSRDGANELRTQPVKPAWHYLLAQFRDPLVSLNVRFQRVCSLRYADNKISPLPKPRRLTEVSSLRR